MKKVNDLYQLDDVDLQLIGVALSHLRQAFMISYECGLSDMGRVISLDSKICDIIKAVEDEFPRGNKIVEYAEEYSNIIAHGGVIEHCMADKIVNYKEGEENE